MDATASGPTRQQPPIRRAPDSRQPRTCSAVNVDRPFQARASAHLAAAITPTGGFFVLLIVAADDQTAAVALSIEPAYFG